MESRTGKIYTLPDFLTEQLKKITDEDGNPMELDGELWGGNDTFALMSGLARRYENNPDDWNQVTYMIFDTPDSDIPLFEDRVKKVADAIKRAGSIPNIKGVKHKKYDPVTMNIQDELTKVEENGGEGLVLRKPKSSYVFTRSQDMLKVKSWSYKEAIVIGYVEGTGKYTGMVGSLSVKSDDFGEDEDDNTEKKWVNFKVGSGLNDWQRYSGGIEGNWKTKEVQNKIDEARKQMVKKINRTSDTYKNLVDTIKTTIGKERSDALHQMNEIYTQMPLIGDVITFRFKELTKDGNPSMGTFVGVRDYE
jgi:ATP-dependent DNA ligase